MCIGRGRVITQRGCGAKLLEDRRHEMAFSHCGINGEDASYLLWWN